LFQLLATFVTFSLVGRPPIEVLQELNERIERIGLPPAKAKSFVRRLRDPRGDHEYVGKFLMWTLLQVDDLVALTDSRIDIIDQFIEVGKADDSKRKISRAPHANTAAGIAHWDVFVSHASEDKDSFARPLATALQDRGLHVWFDEFTLRVGDSLRRSIDRGLAKTRFGVVVVSPSFLEKEWPQKELDGLVAREVDGRKVILPVWHNVTADLVRGYSPTLADRLATSSAKGLETVVRDLLAAIQAK